VIVAHTPAANDPDAHEFSPEQDAQIASFATATRGWGFVSLVVGVLDVVAMLVLPKSTAAMLTYAIPGAVALVVAAAFVEAASSLRKITHSRGHDMAHLFTALGKLGVALKIQALVTLLALVVGFAVGAMGAM
jgi:hypothetical protein